MAIVLETEGSILSIQIQLKPISYAYINATQINVLISNEIQCKYNTNTCIQLKCHKKEGVKVGHQVKVSRVQQPPINAICIYICATCFPVSMLEKSVSKVKQCTVSSKGGQVGGKWFSTTKMGPFVNLVVLLIFCTKTVISAFLLCWWSAGR